ncbi:DNA repair helicase rad5 [Aspergillus terreus]|uniref:DNA repair helicase rad5 n=1 Tax=Aspergillus terreus TaxID=33178 RepID=A0A5M3YSY8_ASPTE|nr:hypothetical protein ATETN484_0002015600 [Aspergillus terreus]GFF14939.1 DNA repair helicase rad5 [Aspergillus terreus]
MRAVFNFSYLLLALALIATVGRAQDICTDQCQPKKPSCREGEAPTGVPQAWPLTTTNNIFIRTTLFYDAIKDVFIDNINGMCMAQDAKVAQYRCFLTMILFLRMFSSHTLTAQTIVKKVLTPNLLNQLSGTARVETASDWPSKKITQWLIVLSKNAVLPAGPPQQEAPEESSDEHQGNKDELTKSFHAFMAELHEREQWEERLERTQCANCTLPPESPVLTDCKHMYCSECFHMLEEKKVDGAMKRVCQKKCRDVIGATALLGTLENMPSEAVISINEDILESPKRSKPKKKKKETNSPANAEGAESDKHEDEENDTDWVQACGCKMPSAKLSKITQIVSEWMQGDSKVKVVIFTQFLRFIDILAGICREKKWRFARLTGTMSVAAREESLTEFRENENVQVLIASLKAGGVGLDMSMASKCIIVDLWWNEGIQQQAFCRLLRIGQKNTVEVVKLIAGETIDDYMHRLQTEKTRGINKTMGEDVLARRDNIFRLIEMFADVTHLESGGFTIQSRKQ